MVLSIRTYKNEVFETATDWDSVERKIVVRLVIFGEYELTNGRTGRVMWANR